MYAMNVEKFIAKIMTRIQTKKVCLFSFVKKVRMTPQDAYAVISELLFNL